jgi:hypothetical protein
MHRCFTCVLVMAVTIFGTQSLASAQDTQNSPQTALKSQVEEIYIARSDRQSRTPPTGFCTKERTGFTPNLEDQYKFHATATRPTDGRMIDTNGKTIATGHGCFGATAEPAIQSFYLELQIGKTALKGIGDCRLTKTDFPERGLTVFHCILDLSDPSGRYIGGQLTTNTMNSRKLLGVDSDPSGYAQPSIATIRLWKKRM